MRINQAPTTCGRQLLVCSLVSMVALVLVMVPETEAAFSTPSAVVSTPQDSSDQQVATSGGNVYLAWRDIDVSTGMANPEIYVTTSNDGGKNFGPFLNVSQSAGTFNTSNPRIAASGVHVYIVYSESDGAYLAHSSDSGASFPTKVNLTTTFGLQLASSAWLAATGSNLYMVFRQSAVGGDDIFMARFGNYGASFIGVQNVSNSSVHSIEPRVAASGNSVYVVWSDPVGVSNNDIFLRRSTDGGAAFDLVASNISNNAGLSRNPAIDTDGLNVWVAWKDSTPLNEEVFFLQSTNGGDSFGPAINLSNTASGSIDPFVSGRGNNVFVAWADLPPGATLPSRDIYLRSSDNAGATFVESQNLSNSATIISGIPRVTISQSEVSVYWGESIPLSLGSQRDIFSVHQSLAVPVPPPTMLSLSPNSGMQTQNVDVLLTGTGFQEGAVWQLSGTGVTVNNVEFVSPTSMKGKMNIALSAAPGGHHLTVTNPDGQSATLPGAFTVMSASTLMLIEMTRTDVNMGVGTVEVLAGSSDSNNPGNSSYKSLLAHLENAENALLQQPVDLATAINEMDAFYIKIGNLAKGKKPEITMALYTTLYNDYAMVMGSLGGTVKPAH